MSVTIQVVTPAPKAQTWKAIEFGLTDFEDDSSGVGGWESLNRPRRDPAAGWVGTPERTYNLPVILDGIDAFGPDQDRVISGDLAVIQAWGRPTVETKEPPILQVIGARRISTSERWVLQGIEWGPYLTNDDNQVIQQELTIQLLRYYEPTLVMGPARKARTPKPKPKPKPKKKRKPKRRRR
jgi:hypothetical protein